MEQYEIDFFYQDPLVLQPERKKVMIRCNDCGERYTLRGHIDFNGHYVTGFKRCLCNNEDDFEFEPL